jgi:hypothetical protein
MHVAKYSPRTKTQRRKNLADTILRIIDLPHSMYFNKIQIYFRVIGQLCGNVAANPGKPRVANEVCIKVACF